MKSPSVYDSGEQTIVATSGEFITLDLRQYERISVWVKNPTGAAQVSVSALPDPSATPLNSITVTTGAGWTCLSFGPGTFMVQGANSYVPWGTPIPYVKIHAGTTYTHTVRVFAA